MANTTLKFIGYFPKKNRYENPAEMPGECGDSFRAAGVREIASVSECIRPGPDNWIDLWKHNDLGFYDSEDIVRAVIEGAVEEYTIFACKLLLVCYENDKPKPEGKMLLRARQLNITEDLAAYRFAGYDVVSSEYDFFECSALSCNGAFEEY